MTKLQRTFRRPAEERGFTLIELLVVIIILGILAAVVVFAVSGVGDKGKSSAVAIDERTLQTAQEAYCAKEGRYANGDELVTAGLLSDLPKYHKVVAQHTGGTCNGWTYSILETSAANLDSGNWTVLPAPPDNGGALMRLSNGKVVSLAGNSDNSLTLTMIWDPANGQWVTGDSLPAQAVQPVERYGSVVLADDPRTPGSECGSNCDKILFHTLNGLRGWHLFNAQAGPGSQWEFLADTPAAGSFDLWAMIQFKDDPSTATNECGQNCGKVFLNGSNIGAELYDPKVSGLAAFTAFAPGSEPLSNLKTNVLLPDGRVLMVGSITGSGIAARLLDPATLQVSVAATPPFSYANPRIIPPLLPSGEVLVFPTSGSGGAHTDFRIYTPAAGGPGSWRQPAVPTGCFTPPSPTRYCRPLRSLPDGRVLAGSSTTHTSATYSSYNGGTAAWIFDPTTERWSQTSDFPNIRLVNGATLDPRTAPCGTYCNKMLVIGGFLPTGTPLVSAFLYTLTAPRGAYRPPSGPGHLVAEP